MADQQFADVQGGAGGVYVVIGHYRLKLFG
jgi:hypothetical protein